MTIAILAMQGAFLEHGQMLDPWAWNILKSGKKKIWIVLLTD